MTLPHFFTASLSAWLSRLGWILLVLLLLPPIRRMAESSMTAHMLVQYTGLLLAGALIVGRSSGAAQHRWYSALQRCNELGIAGLVGSALTLAVLMVPRVLDLALVDARVESLKLLALVLSGAALGLSWRRAGTVVQAFFLGNVLPMAAVVGTLYQESTTRVCNAYLLDDQRKLGMALVWMAIGVVILWLMQLMRQHRQAASPAQA